MLVLEQRLSEHWGDDAARLHLLVLRQDLLWLSLLQLFLFCASIRDSVGETRQPMARVVAAAYQSPCPEWHGPWVV